MIPLLMSSASSEADVFSSNAITEIADAMDKYGILTVILAGMMVAIGVTMWFILKSNKKRSNDLSEMLKEQNQNTLELLKEQNENTLKQNSILLDKITELTDQQHKDANAEKKLVNIFMRLNFTLKDECHQVQEKLNCMRVGVYACHNGSKTNTGLPFFKTSCVSEWISKKYIINGAIGIHSDLQLGVFYNIVKEVFEKGYYVIKDAEGNKEEMPNAYKYLSGLGAKSSVIIAIMDTDELHIGAVAIEFNEKLEDDERITEIVNEGRRLAEKIAPLLDYSLYDQDTIDETHKNTCDCPK